MKNNADAENETVVSKAEQSTQDSWAKSYAQHYQSQSYELREDKKGKTLRAGILLVTILIVVVVSAGVLFAFFQDDIWLMIRNGIQSVDVGADMNAALETEIDEDDILERIGRFESFMTTQYTYSGEVRYEKGEIPFLTHRAYTVKYCANVVLGIPCEQMNVEVNATQVIVMIPRSQVISLEINEDSIEFIDEVKTVFSDEHDHDGDVVLSDLEADTRDNMNIDEMTQYMETRLEEGIIAMLEQDIGNRQLVIRHT